MAGEGEEWICNELAKLGIDASHDIACYLLSIEEEKDLKEYVLEILDENQPQVQKFLQNLLLLWKRMKVSELPSSVMMYKKSDVDDLFVGKKKTKKKKDSLRKSFTPTESGRNENYSPCCDNLNGDRSHCQEVLANSIQEFESGAKKRTKYVPLLSQEGQARMVVKLPGRHPCECQAAKHALINNCLGCGRVVCQQEGSGPCIFCGTLVCTPEEQEVIARGSKKGEKLRQFLLKESGNLQSGEDSGNKQTRDGFDSAVMHKNKLLEYDRISVRRTRVIDDESDYFSTDSNKWLNKKEREALRKREEELRAERYGSRRDRKITFDFAGRKVLDSQNETGKFMYDGTDDVVQQTNFGVKPERRSDLLQQDADLVNPNLTQPAPVFICLDDSDNRKMYNEAAQTHKNRKTFTRRIQDKELQEMGDDGMCLSMHQPWASLLIQGIKLHEGRTWYTAHRGRLWIAATAKIPSTEELVEMEQTYRQVYKGQNLYFPNDYPAGCLLGCVDVVDCLPQEEYRQQYPDGESASPFVFICENPQQLVVKFPIKGKHKIYKLESHIHQAARKGLQ